MLGQAPTLSTAMELSSMIVYMSRPTPVELRQNSTPEKFPEYDFPLIVTVKFLFLMLSALLTLIIEVRVGVHGNVTNIVAVIGDNGATATRPSVVTR